MLHNVRPAVEVEKIPGYAAVGILSIGMESLPETRHGKMEIVKRRATNVKCNQCVICQKIGGGVEYVNTYMQELFMMHQHRVDKYKRVSRNPSKSHPEYN